VSEAERDEDKTPTQVSSAASILRTGCEELVLALREIQLDEAGDELRLEADRHLAVFASWATTPPSGTEWRDQHNAVLNFYERTHRYLEERRAQSAPK